MTSTQDHLPIEQIRDDIVILKDGSMALVLQTTAVNFGLLSENEQLAIIGGFAALLNSLSFSIQILIRSKRLDISSYLKLLEEAQQKQTNLLLSKMMTSYRAFIEKTVRENEVLDKQFYIIVPVSFLELGVLKDVEGHFQKGLTLLLPRRDQIIRQLWRTGLKATQLNTRGLVNLFYDFYNPPSQQVPKVEIAVPNLATNISVVTPLPPQPTQRESPQPASQPNIPEPKTANLTTPFIVEELADEYGAI